MDRLYLIKTIRTNFDRTSCFLSDQSTDYGQISNHMLFSIRITKTSSAKRDGL